VGEQSKRLERVKTDVPILMTSGWHIHKVILADATIAKDSFLIEWRWRFVHDTVCDSSVCVWNGENNVIEWSEVANTREITGKLSKWSARPTYNQSLRGRSKNMTLIDSFGSRLWRLSGVISFTEEFEARVNDDRIRTIALEEFQKLPRIGEQLHQAAGLRLEDIQHSSRYRGRWTPKSRARGMGLFNGHFGGFSFQTR
jgi:hypothetical protein